MFYSETLLQKTGPLARVWLSANLERKLSKTHILQSSVTDSVDAIVNPGQAPLALRLSGQLLLGVVRIYSRKARYLLDDCNEALMKIKMAFRLSNNNDIPTGMHAPSREALMLPDVLTEADNLEMPPLPDASFLMAQLDGDDSALSRKRRAGSRDINLNEDFANSQFLQSSMLGAKPYEDEVLALDPDDDDLGLDLGLDIDETARGDRSIEFGRDAPADAPLADAIGDSVLNVFSKDDFATNRGRSISIAQEDDGFRIADDDGDLDMAGADMTFNIADDPSLPLVSAMPLDRTRISESPLSDLDPTIFEDRLLRESTMFDETEPIIERRPAQRARKLKILQADNETVISSAIIKAQQADHSKILKKQTSLPRDPALYALMEMQRTGGFVSNVLRDGRSAVWAPELRGMLSFEAIANARSLKRKRDSGIADMDIDAERMDKSQRLDIDIGEDDVTAGDLAHDVSLAVADRTVLELPDDEAFGAPIDDEVTGGSRPASRDADAPPSPIEHNFDETTAPLIHPADSGPVSLGTKHAVHLLRDQFGSEAADSPSKRSRSNVVFQTLLPEKTTSKSDATKMFFEILVLATKDAVKVEQKEGDLGGHIRVRGKRGLWGSWAETEAGGEIALQENNSVQPASTVVAATA